MTLGAAAKRAQSPRRPRGQDKSPWARRLATRPDSPNCGCQGGSRLQGSVRSDPLLDRPDFRRSEPGASEAHRLAAGHQELGLLIKSGSAALAHGIK